MLLSLVLGHYSDLAIISVLLIIINAVLGFARRASGRGRHGGTPATASSYEARLRGLELEGHPVIKNHNTRRYRPRALKRRSYRRT